MSFSKDEVKALKDSIAKSDNYKKLFESYKVAADAALTQTPNPIEKVRSQGLLQGDPVKTASLNAVQDVSKVHALALSYRLYGNKRYFDKALEYLTAWAKMNKATGGPIDETKLEDMFVGYDLIRSETKAAERKLIDNWLDSIANAELNSYSIKGGRKTAVNNWNSHRVKVITMIAFAIHSKKYQEAAIQEMEKQIAQNLMPDGTSEDYHERDALHYHIYSLEPLLKAAIVLKRATGKNYFTYRTPQGASIEKSTDFLTRFVTGEKKHQEFANSTVAFDKARAANGEQGYIVKDFNPSNGIVVLALADYFSSKYKNVIQQVKGKSAPYFDLQLAVNQIKKI